MKVIQAYRFALDPSPAQEAALRSHCGAQRFAFNWGLARVKANLDQREAERSYGMPEELLTPAVSWSAWSLRKDFNQVKHQVAPWWPENSKEAYGSGLANLAAALTNWAASRAGNRKGAKVRFPKFKAKRSVLSVRFNTGALGLAKEDRRHVQLPRIGLVRTHESTRKLTRRIQAGTARIRSVTVSYRRGRWFASFSVETDRGQKTPARPDDTVGVDVGITHLAVLSTGQLRHDRSRGPERDRDAEEPAAGEAHCRRRVRADPPPARLQDGMVRRAPGDGRPVLSVFEDLLGLWRGESQTAPVGADLLLSAMRTGPGPGPQCCPQPRRPGRRHVLPESRGDGKRVRWKPGQDPHRRAPGTATGRPSEPGWPAPAPQGTGCLTGEKPA